MVISATCLKRNSAFSLIELLVVLMLLSMLTTLVIPNLMRIYESVRVRGDRDVLIDRINMLGQIAYESGRQIELKEVEGKIALTEEIDIQFPTGWSVEIPDAIIYGSNGACSGGKIELFYEEGSELNVWLSSPHCQIKN